MRNGPSRELSLIDAVSLIVGIIIGVGIYQMAPAIAGGAGSAAAVLGIWVLGGLLSLCGAMGYAELASAYPEEAGGDYVYLTRAYGRWAGFLFGWIQLVIVRPGDIAVVAFAFATYAAAVYDPWATADGASCAPVVYAVAATLVLTAINVIGVRQGKWTQNILTAVKTLGVLAVAGVAFVAPAREAIAAPTETVPVTLALIFVLFCYGGWNEMAYVAAEVKQPRRNIVRALVWGTLGVTVLYLLLNGAFLSALGYGGLAGSAAVATDSIATVFPRIGGRLISALICVSALGALNGLVFTGARISYAVGRDHALFRLVGRWSTRARAPVRALLLQGAIAIGLILVLGSFIDTIVYTAPVVYAFLLATNLAVIVLRKRDSARPRPYRVTAYPLPTILFCAVCAFLAHSAIMYKPRVALTALGVLLLGFPLYAVSRRMLPVDASPEEKT